MAWKRNTEWIASRTGFVAAEREGEVGDAAGNLRAGTPLLDAGHGLDERLGEVCVLLHPGSDGEDVRVEDDVLGREADLVHEQPVGALADLDLAVGRLGLALLVEGHHHNPGAVPAHLAGLGEEVLLPLLEAEGVDDPLALDALEPRLEHRPARAVHHDRQARHLGLGGDQVEEGCHGRLGIEEVGVHVHVEEVRPAAHLVESDVERALEVVSLDQAPEPRRARDVRALADHDEVRVPGEGERLEPAEAGDRAMLGDAPRRDAPEGGRDRAGVVRGRPAAAADDVHEPALRELAEQGARRVRPLVVAAEGVRQARVGVGARVAVRDAGQLLHVVADLPRAERAVDADDQRPGVLDGRPERLERLAGERSAGEVDDRDRDPERQVEIELVEHVAGGDDRRLRVQGVEDRLHQKQVDAAVDEAANLLGVALPYVVEGHRPVRRVVHLRRERERLIERPQGAGHEARPVLALVTGLPGEPCALDVQLVDDFVERVVSLTDAGGREGVRGRDVRAGIEIGAVDVEDDVRPGEVEHVRVARDLVRMVAEALPTVVGVGQPLALEHGPPGPVEHEDALREQFAQESRSGAHGCGHGRIVPSGGGRG